MAEQVDVPVLNVVTGEAVAQHRLLRLSAAKTVLYCDAGEWPLGPARVAAPITTPLAVPLLLSKPGTIKCVGDGVIAALADVYTAADGKVSATNSGVKVGIAMHAVTTDGDVVEVLPCVERVPMVNTAASANIGATSTTEADFDKTFSIPASELKAGSIIRVRAAALVVSQDSTPQLTVKMYAGTEVVSTVVVAACAANDELFLDAEIVIRTIGASGTLVASAAWILDAPGTAIGVRNKASATEDTTGGLTIKLSGTFNASHATNLARLDILRVEHIR